MSISNCDLRVSSRLLFLQESTYLLPLDTKEGVYLKKVYAKTFVFTLIKTLLFQPLHIKSNCILVLFHEVQELLMTMSLLFQKARNHPLTTFHKMGSFL